MAQVRQVTVDASRAGKTLAAILRLEFPGESWNDIRRRIHSRRVKINDVVCVDDARRLRGGDVVEVLARPAGRPARPQDVLIIHQDQHLLVIDKPPGMECERRPEQANWSAQKRALAPTVVEALQTRGFAPRPVHRLDRDTSGLMVYALSQQAQENLIRQLASRSMQRIYLALAIGEVGSCTVKNWIIRDRGDGLRGCVDSPLPGALEAASEFRQLETIASKYTLLECRLKTGRTHQIRLHLASMGHPVCGEKLYRKPSVDAGEIPDTSGAARHALHATRLTLHHPADGRQLNFESPLPPDLVNMIERLRKSV